MQSSYYAGLDIGGTKCAVIIGSEQLDLIDKTAFPTEVKRGPEKIIDQLKQTLHSLTDKYGKEGLKRIGISCGGPLNSKKGLIMSPPNLPGWDNIPITGIFEKEFGVPAVLQNDANACALAEWKLGAGKGCDNMVFLTFGTGMGAGLILDGRLYSGTSDCAGEVGHVRLDDDGPTAYGKAGSFEGFCSGAGIALLAKKIIKEKLQAGIKVGFCPNEKSAEQITTKDVGIAAQGGDPVAIEIFALSGRYLGKGLAMLIDIINPQKIVIGSVFARSERFLRPAAEEVIKQEALHEAASVCEIVPAALGEQIGDFASVSLAVYG